MNSTAVKFYSAPRMLDLLVKSLLGNWANNFVTRVAQRCPRTIFVSAEGPHGNGNTPQNALPTVMDAIESAHKFQQDNPLFMVVIELAAGNYGSVDLSGYDLPRLRITGDSVSPPTIQNATWAFGKTHRLWLDNINFALGGHDV